MRPFRPVVIFLAISLALTVSLVAQAPLCDVTCGPDTSSPSYAGAVAARTKMLNGRGSSNPLVAKTLPLQVNKIETVIGSQSYNYVIPILNIPGRAGLDLTLNLYYNSRVWDVDNVNNTVTFNADRDFPSYGFRLDFGYVEKTGTGLNGSAVVTTADGAKHQLIPGTSTLYDSTDGTYLEYNTQTNALYFKNGTIMYYEGFPSQGSSPTLFRPTQIRDTNGNCIFFAYLAGHDDLLQYIVDTGNRVIVFNYDSSNRLSNIAQQVQVSPVDPTGVHTYATFTWGTLYGTGAAWYNFSGLTVNGAPANNVALNVLTACTYANGTGYRFTYGDWAVINKIENLSATGTTRSYISYNYPLASAGPISDAPFYTQQTVSPDGLNTNTSVWTYSATKAGTGVVTSMTTVDPVGNSSVSTLDQNTGVLTQVQLKDSTNAVLSTTGYLWTSSGNGTVPSKITTVNDVGQVSYTMFGYDLSFGNLTDVYEYDFGNVLKRHTVTTFQNDTTNHILGLPTQVLIKDGGGTTISRTDTAYDGGTLSPNITGLGTHDDAGHGVGYTARGNLTSVTRYSNAAAGTGAIVRNFTYDTLGNQRTAQVDCCNSKTFNFSSGTQYAYPDSVARGPSGGPQFTSSYTYNNDKGLLAGSTDENNQVTQYQYDSMNRMTAVLLPSQGGTVVQMNTNFDDSAASPTVKAFTTNSGNTAVQLATLDGLGHVLQVDSKDGTTVFSTTKSVYDKLWRRTQVSNPYGPSETPVYTTSSYDGLSRVTLVTPPSAGYTQYSYSGNTVTVTDPVGKKRKNYLDALGRLIEVDEPGWGDALPGAGQFTVNGFERSFQWDPCFDPDNLHPHHCPRTVWDSGTVSITINGHADSTGYGSADTTSSVALGLTNAINADSLASVTATVSGATITLTAKTAGASTNYSVSSSSTSSDPTDFGTSGSFVAQPTPSALAGGVNATPQTSPTLARPVVTSYVYDVLNNLTSVSLAAMGLVSGTTYAGQPRTYVYDSLSRLTSATTPESGTVANFYTDASGFACASDPTLVCRVQDARSIVKTLTYDGINRPLTVAYSDGTPGVTYAYDVGGAAAFALGRLTSITENGNSQTLTYDNLGHILSASQTIDSVNYPLQYTYNLLGQLATVTYPSGHVVTQNYDGVGRAASIVSGGTTYLNGLSYNAAGEMLGLTMGNGVQGSFTYNDHLQLASLRYFKTGLTPDPLNLSYDYTSAAQPNNNGQIQAIHYFTAPGTEDQTKSESFTYDPWFRLSAAQTISVSPSLPGTWSLTWGYDRLGNRKQQTLVNGSVSIGQPNLGIDESTNRITGFSYDAAGNMTGDSAFTYTYDGTNRMKQAQQIAAPNTLTSSTFFSALRIKKTVGATTTRYIYAGSTPIAEYVNGTLNKEYVYAGSILLATVAGATITYHHPDHLSSRAETDSTGTTITRTFGHFPYGEAWYETGTADKRKFTSYERDSSSGETGLDYAQFRNYSSGLGRFMSPDPYVGSINLTIPQSFNTFAYVLNEPISFIDPTGLDCVIDGAVDGSVDTDIECEALGGVWDDSAAATPGADVDGGPPPQIPILTPPITPTPFGMVPTGASGGLLNFLASCEGFSATSYEDALHNCTIGFGHLLHLGPCTAADRGLTVTRPDAMNQLTTDVNTAVNALNNNLTAPLTQNQFDAMVSLTFNMGMGRLQTHDVWRDVNSGNMAAIPRDIRSLGAGGPGMPMRRANEANMFQNGAYANACYSNP